MVTGTEPISRPALARILQSLLTAELTAVRRRAAPAGVIKTAPGGLWRDGLALLGNECDSLGCDSLEIMWLAGAVNEMFHLHEAGDEMALLSAASFGDWLDRILAAWGAGVAKITFTTSGSTGAPKRCTHSFAHLQTEIGFLGQAFATRQRIVAMAPAHHIYGFLLTAMLPDRLGVAVLNADHAAAVALQSGDLIVSYPERWAWLNRFIAVWPADVAGIVSTAPCPPGLIAGLAAQGLSSMMEVYGSSDTAGVAVRVWPGDAYRLMPHWRFDAPVDPAHPMLMHSSGLRMPLMDRIALQTDDAFTLAGRRDGALLVGGTNVYPDRIAALLLQRPGIAEASVRLMRFEEGDRLKAFIVPGPGVPEDDIRSDFDRWSAAHLSSVERPRAFTFGTALPRGPTGKLTDW
ncbi:AMP-binding protein [Beijerinckia sp. L45]|uniref:AMP-binding protein n=1 Tax=Beijerinckia sp. L45 TaxID=1641855 RepID=UPI00131C08D2|nr:AMP-binding protein [Beijerinckia sp. L45]